ncbi:helix-turn-helix transcriptional regulator [Jiulongibacter sediminis]|uniref:Helix-turn-helix domain-containing protein n=1 Tax=Jiulongibacter sediminis TaxID=1605367 RepID=A0A0P7C8M6_9BACT|nr:helix-turn-helix domain-containing protein [Jiulongibacter sediminis]KPM50018.1 hypothetical protein AFM12_05565 [Jiulongibacter sediminis]TBX27046.1 hypothetical protein TK44_05570 [Jiulongibacter sediminis]
MYTFNELPEAVTAIANKLDVIERLLKLKNSKETEDFISNRLLTLDQACSLLKLQKSTLYSKVSRGEIPGVYKQAGRLYFKKEELLKWLEAGEKKTTTKILEEADQHLAGLKKGGVN